MGSLGKFAKGALFPTTAVNDVGKGKNKPPPNYLGEASRQATGAVMPGLIPSMQQGVGYDPSQDINKAIQANWEQSTSRLDPMWQQRQQAFGSQMANQGLDPGTAAYDASAGTLNRAQTDAYQTALRGAIGQGNETARTAFAAKMLPFNQYGALMGGGAPGAQQAADVYEAQQRDQAGKKNAMASAAPYAIMASDERLKEDIERLPYEWLPGVPVANWRWKGGLRRIWGVIAQDLEKVAPHMVVEHSGIKMVNYALLMR